MTKTRIISLIIVTAGILGAFVIISQPSLKEISLTSFTATKKGESSLNFKTSPITQPTPLSQISQNNILKNNLTEDLAQSYLQEIFKRNPDGPQILDNEQKLAIPSEQAFSDLLQNYLSGNFVWVRFEIQNIKVSLDNSKTNKLKHIKVIHNLLQKKEKEIGEEFTALNDFLEEQKSDGLRVSISSTQKEIEELLKNITPSDNQFLHLQVLNAWQKQISIYKAVLNLPQDPVKALLAVNEVAESANDLQNLNLLVENKYQELES